jgi:hypothetical protein
MRNPWLEITIFVNCTKGARRRVGRRVVPGAGGQYLVSLKMRDCHCEQSEAIAVGLPRDEIASSRSLS